MCVFFLSLLPATPACLVDPALGDHEYMTANGIKFHYVVKGGRTKPLMLLLHGFPEVPNSCLCVYMYVCVCVCITCYVCVYMYTLVCMYMCSLVWVLCVYVTYVCTCLSLFASGFDPGLKGQTVHCVSE